MKFVIDEGVDRQVVERLRSEGHDVIYIAEEEGGISDDVILNIANQQNRILMTRDKDFGELVYHLRKVHSGIILNRLYELTSITKAEVVSKVIREHENILHGCFTVIQPGRVSMKEIKS